MTVQDFYYRRNGGPVIHARVWDRQLFVEARINESMRDKEPWKFTLANADEYAAERRKQ